jgi:hypothetical protein
MTSLFDDIASASLPVAVGLLILAATARAVLWAQVEDARARRVAAQYLEPLATWSVLAILVHAVALGGAGELSFGGLGVALAIAFAGVLLRPGGEPAQAPEPAAGPAPAPAAQPEAPRPGGLWSR